MTAIEGQARGTPASPPHPFAPAPSDPHSVTHAAAEGVQAAAGMAIGRVLILGTALATAILVPRLMGPEHYGAYASIMALVALFMLVSESGIGSLEMRVLAPAWRAGSLSESCELASTTWTLRMMTSAVAGLGVVLVLNYSGGLGITPTVVGLIGLMAAGRFVATANSNPLVALGRRRLYIGIELGRSVAALLAVLIGFSWMGLEGAFAGLLLIAVGASLLSHRVLRSVIPFSPGRISRATLNTHRRFMLWSAPGQILGGVQFWLPLYLVGVYRPGGQAGYLAIAVQVLGVVNAVAASARLGMMPNLAELVETRRRAQLRRWGSLILRLGSTINCLGILLWLGVGRALVDLLWSFAYQPVFEVIALMLFAHVFLSAGALFQSLLNLHGRAASASLNTLGFTSATLAGTWLGLATGAGQIALWVAGTHAVAAGIFATTGYLTLGLREGIWMPIGKAMLPPIALAGVVLAVGRIPHPGPALTAGSIALCLLAAPLLSIVRVTEVRQILRALSAKRAESGA